MTTTTLFDDDASKYNDRSYHEQVYDIECNLFVIAENSIIHPDEYDSRRNGIDFQHPHLHTLPIISAIFVRNLHI